MQATFFHGDPTMVDYTPAAAVDAGDVVLNGDLAMVAHQDIAASALGALAIAGGVYKMTGDAAIAVGKRVFWNATAEKVTETAEGNRPFGWTVSACSGNGSSVYVYHGVERPSGLIYVAVAASAAISDTTSETDFDKTVTIPANTLKAGDVIRVRAQAIPTSTNSTDTLTLKLKFGSTVIVATAAVDVANNDIGYIDFEVTIRTIGASGTMVGAGVQALGVPGTVTAKPALLASTTIDTTAAIVVKVSATWSNASASNSVRLDVLNVELLRK